MSIKALKVYQPSNMSAVSRVLCLVRSLLHIPESWFGTVSLRNPI